MDSEVARSTAMEQTLVAEAKDARRERRRVLG
jgi:hypothetical protein